MLTGKAYSRAIRAHFFASSALMSMLLEELFWENLINEERSHFKMLHDSDSSSEEDDDLADSLAAGMNRKKSEITSSPSTVALWLNYIQYIHIVQVFIRGERTSNRLLYIVATKSMLNLFAATGHTAYAKTCHLS